MTGVVGIDLALKRTGLASERGTRAVEVDPALGDALRIRTMADAVIAELEETRAPRAVLEGQFGSANAAGQLLVGLHWHLRAELDRLGVTVLVVANTTVKIFATGRGRAVPIEGESDHKRRKRFKQEIVADVEAASGLQFDGDDDQAEALVLRCIGLELDGFTHPMGLTPASRRRAIDGLQWPLPPPAPTP